MGGHGDTMGFLSQKFTNRWVGWFPIGMNLIWDLRKKIWERIWSGKDLEIGWRPEGFG